MLRLFLLVIIPIKFYYLLILSIFVACSEVSDCSTPLLFLKMTHHQWLKNHTVAAILNL